MTTTIDVLLREILENPDDDTPRLVAADWWEENGQEARAEFVRLQCTMAKIEPKVAKEAEGRRPGIVLGTETLYYAKLVVRERELLLLPLEPQIAAFAWSQPIHDTGVSLGRPWTETFTFRRGFVEQVTLTLAQFMKHAPVLFQALPITKVVLRGKYPWDDQNAVERGRGWRWFCGRLRTKWWADEDHDDLPREFIPYFLEEGGGRDDSWIVFPTEKEAAEALPRVCVRYGCEKAGVKRK